VLGVGYFVVAFVFVGVAVIVVVLVLAFVIVVAFVVVVAFILVKDADLLLIPTVARRRAPRWSCL
jgi:hypothetical protein